MLKAKIGAIAASSALVLSLLTPAAFAKTTVDVSGNGADSDNTVKVKNVDNTTVDQNNTTTIGISINSSASTGGNKANGNTGGDVSIDTGKAVSTVGIEIKGSTNEINMPDCGCADTDNKITVSGNGKDSETTVKVKKKSKKEANQNNTTTISAGVTSKAKTGKNKAKNNTGDGTVEVKTDDSTSEVSVTVEAPSNTINP